MWRMVFTVAWLGAAACGGAAETPVTPSYSGSWTGLCEHLRDCDCSPFEAVATCATTLESGYEGGMARARELGMAADEVASRAMSPEQLHDIANTPCETLCAEAAAFSRASGR